MKPLSLTIIAIAFLIGACSSQALHTQSTPSPAADEARAEQVCHTAILERLAARVYNAQVNIKKVQVESSSRVLVTGFASGTNGRHTKDFQQFSFRCEVDKGQLTAVSIN